MFSLGRVKKVSVLVPVYNVERYLRQCLDSVLAQTLKDIEVVCVNDGSTDSSPAILKEYASKDSRIKIINQKNSGYGTAMNVATDNAIGEYIGIVEPDDFIEPDMFEILYNAAVQNDLDFVKSDFYRFITNENGNPCPVYFAQSKNPADYNSVFCPLEKLESFRFEMNTWCGLYKRDFILKNNIRYNTTPGASFQDNGFYFLTQTFAKRAMLLNKAFYWYRNDNPGSSINNSGKIYAMNVEYDYIRKCLEKYPVLWERVKGWYWLRKFANYNYTICRIEKSCAASYIKEFRKEFKRALQRNELDLSIFNKRDKFKYFFFNKPISLYSLIIRKGARKCL